MDNIFKFILLGVGAVVTAAIVGAVVYFNNMGSELNSDASSSLQSSISDLSDTDKALYDGTTMSGDQVISAISKFNDDPQCYVIVCTKNNGNAYWCAYGDVLREEANLGEVQALITNCVGFPAKDANGVEFAGAGADSKTVASAVSEKVNWPNNAETGGYNATLESTEPNYIAPSASFKSSLQKDENNAVRFITFVQQ